jgi:hypothetical protein
MIAFLGQRSRTRPRHQQQGDNRRQGDLHFFNGPGGPIRPASIASFIFVLLQRSLNSA